MEIAEIKSYLRLTYQNRIFIRKSILMNTKLTLNVDKAIIEQAKIYARAHKISLSRLIESYLASLSSQTRMDIQITPLVESLSGLITLEADYDYKQDYTDHLSQKYE